MNIVIFSGLVNIDKNLVGTAVIYKKIADLAKKLGYQVDMVIPNLIDAKDDVKYCVWEKKNNQKLINQADIVVFGAYPPVEPLNYARQKKKIIVSYLWSVAPIGSMEFRDYKDANKQRELHEFISSSYNLQLLLSDKIFCRDHEVRKLIIGSLLSLGRIDLNNYYEDRTLNSLIEAAPFGIEDREPRHKKNIYRGIINGIEKNDFLLLSSGGIWNWNDGETLVKTMGLIDEKYKLKNIKLILQGFRHPDKKQKLSFEAEKTLKLAKNYGLLGKNIFLTDWVPFLERENYLTECDAGIVTSPDIPEANFFLKTRIYDYLWAELPVLLGDNEAFAGIVMKNRLGLIAKCGQADDWAKNIVYLYKNKKGQKQIKTNIKKIKKVMTWKKTLKPIEIFLKNPKKDKNLFKNDRKLFINNIKYNSKL